MSAFLEELTWPCTAREPAAELTVDEVRRIRAT
jgi:hypothetical protein